ncbi:nucleotidyltransferase [uncultured Candidatus Thioglobus sp.]|nr:nucleotidyltransferase [uncultured Candidatus Thioglobus sp.]
MKKLDLTNFKKAILSFKEMLDRHQRENFEDDAVRDSCIQRFEYCYDYSKKILKRYLKSIADDPMEIDNESLENLIRDAYTKGLTKHSWDVWDEYRDNRNKTSHGYDQEIAIAIVEQLPAFYSEIEFLLEALISKDET